MQSLEKIIKHIVCGNLDWIGRYHTEQKKSEAE